MNPNDLATKYHLLNRSFKKTMIYHIGLLRSGAKRD